LKGNLLLEDLLTEKQLERGKVRCIGDRYFIRDEEMRELATLKVLRVKVCCIGEKVGIML